MAVSDLTISTRDFLTALCKSLNHPKSDGKVYESGLASFGYPAAVSRGLLSSLIDKGYIRQVEPPTHSGLPSFIQSRRIDWWELTAKGAEFMLALASEPSRASKPVQVPASDRFVSRTDNESVFSDAEKKLDELIEAVRISNDLRISGEERLAVLSEIQGVRSLIAAPISRAAAIFNATRESAALGWLAKEAGSGTIRALAGAAVVALLALIGWSSGALN